MKEYILQLFLISLGQSYHRSCIVKQHGIGVEEGDFIDDIDLLDRYASNTMRLKMPEFCVDDN